MSMGDILKTLMAQQAGGQGANKTFNLGTALQQAQQANLQFPLAMNMPSGNLGFGAGGINRQAPSMTSPVAQQMAQSARMPLSYGLFSRTGPIFDDPGLNAQAYNLSQGYAPQQFVSQNRNMLSAMNSPYAKYY